MPTPLELVLLRKIAETGPISFCEFMALALYDPKYGYYGSGRARIGVRGDFATSSGLHELFGRLIARWALARWDDLGRPDPFDVVELGPGTGRLAADIVDAISETEAHRAFRFTLVERSGALRARQRELLRGRESAVVWRDIAEIRSGSVTGVVLSNELFDALPVHRVRMTLRGLEEARVAADPVKQRLETSWSAPSDPRLADYVAAYAGGAAHLDGLELEVNLGALDLLAEVSRVLRSGYVLTIDYGDVAERLVGPWAPRGTIRAFEGGRVSGDLLERPGERDLTASVNFTALVEHGARLGLERLALVPQRTFLMELGLVEELAALATAAAGGRGAMESMLAAKSLLVPGGIGDMMRVLVQQKARRGAE